MVDLNALRSVMDGLVAAADERLYSGEMAVDAAYSLATHFMKVAGDHSDAWAGAVYGAAAERLREIADDVSYHDSLDPVE